MVSKRPRKFALIVIDMMKLFLDPRSPYDANPAQKRLRRIIPNVAKLVSDARKFDVPIFFVNHGLKRTRKGYDDLGVLAMIEKIRRKFGYPRRPVDPRVFLVSSQWREPVPELIRSKRDWLLRKNGYSAFQGNDLERRLRRLQVDALVITGINTNLCVRATALDAFHKGWKSIVPEECVEARTSQAQRQGLEDIEYTTSEVLSLSELRKILSNETPRVNPPTGLSHANA